MPRHGGTCGVMDVHPCMFELVPFDMQVPWDCRPMLSAAFVVDCAEEGHAAVLVSPKFIFLAVKRQAVDDDEARHS